MIPSVPDAVRTAVGKSNTELLLIYILKVYCSTKLLAIMEVLVNNKLYAVQPATSVAALLQFIQLPTTKGIAVAVNRSVVPRSAWNATVLSPADQVMIIQATQGG